MPVLDCEGVAFRRPPFWGERGKHGETYSKSKEKMGNPMSNNSRAEHSSSEVFVN